MIHTTSVSSSVIRRIGYDKEAKTLHVEMHSGKVYDYPNVSEADHVAFVRAKSIGSHFAKFIQPKHGKVAQLRRGGSPWK